MEDESALSAAEAAAFLGVTRQTLYAYVSRGLVASAPAGTRGGSRAHRYDRRTLQQLRDSREARRSPARGALHGHAPVLETAITAIDTTTGTLAYRGRDAVELSRSHRFEDVAALLWTGGPDAGTIFPDAPSPRRRRSSGPVNASLLRALVDLRASSPPVTLGDTGLPALRAAAAAVTVLFEAAGAVGDGSLPERLARGWSTDAADDLRATLVLCADHGLATSTFTARCVASTDAPISNVLLAGLCALEGRRHGGSSAATDLLLDEVERMGVGPACDRFLEQHGQLPCWVGGVYAGGDPRANELLRRLGPDATSPVTRLLRHTRKLGGEPTLELGLSALARKHRLPSGSTFALFALGRSVGWIAHAFEQASRATLIRPRASYVGP